MEKRSEIKLKRDMKKFMYNNKMVEFLNRNMEITFHTKEADVVLHMMMDDEGAEYFSKLINNLENEKLINQQNNESKQ
jgi:hypothetical protein